jgi:hypothetical protein
MQLQQAFSLQKTQVLPCVPFTSAREQKAMKEMHLTLFIAVGVDVLASSRKEKS